jgi:nitroreductase
MATARTIRRFTGEPVDDATLARCLEAATWAPSGANAQAWRFVVLRSPEMRAVVARAAAQALEVIEPVYGMARPAEDDHSRRARTNRATYELHDRAGELTSVLFAQKRFRPRRSCCSAARSSRPCRTSSWPPGPRGWERA